VLVPLVDQCQGARKKIFSNNPDDGRGIVGSDLRSVEKVRGFKTGEAAWEVGTKV